MDECRVESAARGAALSAVMSGNEQPAVIEQAELFRLHFDLVVTSDRPPHVAPHRLRAVVASTHVERKAVGDVPDEVGMQAASTARRGRLRREPGKAVEPSKLWYRSP